jgi:23S rRNA-intervening sequence protein
VSEAADAVHVPRQVHDILRPGQERCPRMTMRSNQRYTRRAGCHPAGEDLHRRRSRWSRRVFPRQELCGLTTQLRRSGSSIAANLAEGCKRSGDAGWPASVRSRWAPPVNWNITWRWPGTSNSADRRRQAHAHRVHPEAESRRLKRRNNQPSKISNMFGLAFRDNDMVLSHVIAGAAAWRSTP